MQAQYRLTPAMSIKTVIIFHHTNITMVSTDYKFLKSKSLSQAMLSLVIIILFIAKIIIDLNLHLNFMAQNAKEQKEKHTDRKKVSNDEISHFGYCYGNCLDNL